MANLHILPVLALVLFLSACSSKDERAQEHYENAVALMQEGDVDRAIVELRNALQLKGNHLEARHMLADLILNERGNRQRAYSQYLRIAEQYPDDLKARVVLSQMAVGTLQWDEVERHGAQAEKIAADDPDVQAITLARAYRQAVIDEDESARAAAADRMGVLLETQPDDPVLRSLRIDHALRNRAYEAALTDIDWLIADDPGNQRYQRQRLEMLVRLEDFPAVEAQLKAMVAAFPETPENRGMLFRFYMSRDDVDAAETFLRELASAEGAELITKVDLIRFLSEVRGADAARAELEAYIANEENPAPFQVMAAELDFRAGETDKGIAAMQEVIDGLEETAPERDQYRVALARMQASTGNEVGARQLIEAVLAGNPTQVEALKMQAVWLIEADEVDAAIAALRQAVTGAPEDAQALTLMAQAYGRAGQNDLSQDFLARAAQASGNAPAESLRYAGVLISQERFLPAEDILISSLRLNPGNEDILTALGQLYLESEDFGRLDGVINALRRSETPEGTRAANALEAERLNRTQSAGQALAFLEDLAGEAEGDLNAQIALVRARMATGDVVSALDLANTLNTENPDNPVLEYVLAAAEAANGNLEEAARLYRSLVDEDPGRAPVWLQLSNVLQLQGKPDEARAVIAEGLGLNPEAPQLLWADASFKERDGDVEGAIGIYERLYASDSSSVIVANNLASLLSTYRDDQDSLDRAWRVARRLRDTDIPALQDTYGWIVHRRGESQEALRYLEPAAAGLTNEPLAQYHLAEAYFTLGRLDEAKQFFEAALEIAGPADTRDQLQRARARLREIEAGVAAPSEGGTEPVENDG